MAKKKKGWPVLAAGAAMLLFSGVPSAWGVFRKPAAEEYGFGVNQSAFVLNLTVAAFGVGCVLGGLLQDKKGPRAACLIGSGLLAAGFCAAAACPAKPCPQGPMSRRSSRSLRKPRLRSVCLPRCRQSFRQIR